MQYLRTLLIVKDIQSSRAFYESLLGQRVKYDFGDTVIYESGFGIIDERHFAAISGYEPPTPQNGNAMLYFEETDCETLAVRLKQNNIELIHDLREQPWRQKALRFFDPDRHIIEIAEPVETLAQRLKDEGI